MVLKEAGTDSLARYQHRQEVLILKNVSFPGIPELYEYEEKPNTFRIVQEYISGKSLHSTLMQFISQEQFINYGYQMITIVQSLHQHLGGTILYLDFKSEHFLVKEETVYLIDFGLATFAPEGRVKNVYFGTEEYSAPETKKYHEATVASDVYSLGVLLQEMAGKTRFMQKSQRELVERLLFRMTQEAPDRRCPDLSGAKELFEMLKYQKKEVKQPFLNFKIAVLGSQPRVGTTFVAALLTSCLNRLKLPTCYKEDSERRWILSSSLSEEGAFLQTDCWRGSFRASPDYGPFVSSMSQGKEERFIEVKDLGIYKPEIPLEKYNLIICVLGARYWEQQMSEAKFQELKERKNCVFVSSLSSREEVRALSGRIKREVYRIPIMESAFQPDKDIQKLVLHLKEKYCINKN